MNDLTTTSKVAAMIIGVIVVACLASIITLSLSGGETEPAVGTQSASSSQPLRVTETTSKQDYSEYDTTFASMVLAWGGYVGYRTT